RPEPSPRLCALKTAEGSQSPLGRAEFLQRAQSSELPLLSRNHIVSVVRKTRGCAASAAHATGRSVQVLMRRTLLDVARAVPSAFAFSPDADSEEKHCRIKQIDFRGRVAQTDRASDF